MPAQKATNSLVKLLGAKGQKAHESHKADETKYGIIQLPAGINNGKAQLKTVKWDTYKDGDLKGQPYIQFRGIAISPDMHNGVQVSGQGVMLMYPLCDTPKRKLNKVPGTFEGWYGEVLNEFRKLGVDTSETSFDDIEAIIAGLNESQPFFNFSTRGWTPAKTKENPNPSEMVFVQYDGLSEEEPQEVDPNEDVQDQQTETSGDGTEPPTEEVASAEEPEDLNALAVIADDPKAKDTVKDAAQAKIQEAANSVGISQDDQNKTATWTELVAMIAAAASGKDQTIEPEPEPEPEPAKEWAPEKGMVDVKWQPMANGKPAVGKDKKPLKPVQCEITAVYSKNKTCDLKRLDTKAAVKGVKWNDVIHE